MTCTAADGSGNSATTTFVVTVEDTIAPQIATLPDLLVPATSAAGAVVIFSPPSAVDAADPAPSVACSPASGSQFSVGSTLVTCTATDAAGNSAQSSFTITVQPPQQTAVALSVELVPSSASVVAGTTRDLRVRALDAGGQTATDFTGTVLLTTSDGLAPLNGTLVPFQASDQGQRLLPGLALLRTGGTLQISAETLSGPLLQGSVSVQVLPAAPATLSVLLGGGDRTLVTGQAPPLVVAELRDAFGNLTPGIGVRFEVGSDETLDATTDSAGRVNFTAAPLTTTGPRTCSLSTPGHSVPATTFVWTIDAGTPPPGPSVLTVLSGGVNATIDEGERAPTLSVRVNSGSAGGAPKAGQVVTWTIRDDQGELLAERRGITAADGTVSVQGPRLNAVGTHDAEIRVSNPQGPGPSYQITVLPRQHVSGFVLDASRDPGPALGGVVVRVQGTALSTTTDVDGGFRLESVPSGPQVLEFDGRGVGNHAQVSLAVVVSGVTTLGRPLFLPAFSDPAVPVPLNAQSETTQTVSVPLTGQPLARLEIALGARVSFPGGASPEITATSVELDEIVWPLPSGPTPATAVLFGPSGTQFPDGARLELPNDLGLAPGSPMEIYSADLNTGAFTLVGAGTVSGDGTRVLSNGAIVTHFSCFVAVPPPPASPPPPTTVIGRVLAEDNSPLIGASVSFLGISTVTQADNLLTPGVDEAGTFTLSNVPSDGPPAEVSATITNVNGFPESGRSLPTPRVVGGITDVGTFKIVAKTVVRGRLLQIVTPGGTPTPIAGGRASVVGIEALSGSGGVFAVTNVPSALQPVKVFGYRLVGLATGLTVLKDWKLAPVLPPHGEVNVGDLVMTPVQSAFRSAQRPDRVFGVGAPGDRPISETGVASSAECPECGRLAVVSGRRVLVWKTFPENDFIPPDVVLDDSSGSSPGSPQVPVSVALDHSRLYVGDRNRVLVYDLPGLTTGQAPDLVLGQANLSDLEENRGGSAGAETLAGVGGISSDGVRLAVTDNGNNRVLIWQSPPQTTGQPADLVVGQPNFTSTVSDFEGTSARTLCSNPSDVEIEGQRLYVADPGNNRVLVYAPFPTTSTPAASLVLGQADFASNQYDLSALPGVRSVSSNGQEVVLATDRGVAVYFSPPATSTTTPDDAVFVSTLRVLSLAGTRLLANYFAGDQYLRVFESVQAFVSGAEPEFGLFRGPRLAVPEDSLSYVPEPFHLGRLPGGGVVAIDLRGDTFVWDSQPVHSNQPASRRIRGGPSGPTTSSGSTIYRYSNPPAIESYSAPFDPTSPPLFSLPLPSFSQLSSGPDTLYVSRFGGISVYRPLPTDGSAVPLTVITKPAPGAFGELAAGDTHLAVSAFNRILIYGGVDLLAAGSDPVPSTLIGQPSLDVDLHPYQFVPGDVLTRVGRPGYGLPVRLSSDGTRLAAMGSQGVLIWEEFPTTPSEPADALVKGFSWGPILLAPQGLYHGDVFRKEGFAFYSNQPPSSRPEVARLDTPIAPQNSGVVPVTFTVRDIESDSVSVDLAFSVDGGVTFAPLTLAAGSPPTTGLASNASISGVEHTLLWDARADIAGRATEVKLRVLPSDVGGLGTGNHTFEFTVDHDPLGVSEVYSDVAELAPGVDQVEVLTFVTNRSLNPTQIDTSALLFTDDLGADLSAHYTVTADPANSTLVNPNQIVQLRFRVDVAPSAPTQDVTLGARVTGTDTVTSAPLGPSDARVSAKWRVVASTVQASIPEGPQLQAFLGVSGPQNYTIQVSPGSETVNLRIPRRASVAPGSPSLNVANGQTVQLSGIVAGEATLYLSHGTTTIAAFPVTVQAAPPTSLQVLRTDPQDCATGVLLGVGFTIDLSEDLNPATLAGNVELRQGASVVPIQPLVYSAAARQISVVPQAALSPQTTYTLVALGGLQSTGGGALVPVSIEFTTGSSGPEVDDDQDGLLNLEEALYGTSPTNPDTDGDGLSDFDELFVTFTNPTNADTDGDGISDGPLDPDGGGPIAAGPDLTPTGPSTNPAPPARPALVASGPFQLRSLSPDNNSQASLDGKVTLAFTNPIDLASVQPGTNVVLEALPAVTPVALTQATVANPNALVLFPTGGPLTPGNYRVRVVTGLPGAELLDTNGTPLAAGASHDFSATAPSGGEPITREFEITNYLSNLTSHWERFPLMAATAGGRRGGAIVIPATGRLLLQETDVAVPARGLPVGISRVYRNNEQAASGIFGNNWHFAYDCNFELVTSTRGTPAPDWRFRTEDGRLFDYASRALNPADPANRLPFDSPPAFYDTLSVDPSGSFLVRRSPYGVKYFFQIRDSGGAPVAPGSAVVGNRGELVRIEDNQGNATTLTRHTSGPRAGLIDTIRDDIGRTTQFVYGTGPQELLCTRVEQFLELPLAERRAWTYAYDGAGNLQSVTTPPTLTSPAGKSRTYAYTAATTGGGQNLTQITDGNGLASFRVLYDGDDRVAQVDVGVGAEAGTALYLWDFAATTRVATQIDRNGNVCEVRNDTTTPGVNCFLARESVVYTKGLHSGGSESPEYLRRTEYNSQGEWIQVIDAADQRFACIRDDCGCIVNMIRYCDKAADEGTTPEICDQVYSYVWGNDFKNLLVSIEPRGNDVSLIGGSVLQVEDVFNQTPRILTGYDPELREAYTSRSYYQEENIQARLDAETLAAGTPITLNAILPDTWGRLCDSGQEVILDVALGPFSAGEVVNLCRIERGFVGSHAGGCAYPHLHDQTFGSGIFIDGQGPFLDPAPSNCGYGEVRPSTPPTPSDYNDPPSPFFEDLDADGFPDHGGLPVATRGAQPRAVEITPGQQPTLGAARQSVVAAFSYNRYGQPVLAQEPEGATNRTRWNTSPFSASNPGAGMPLASVQATSYLASDLDLLTGAPLGAASGSGLELVTTFAFDGFGRMTSVANPRRTPTSAPDEFVTRFEYDDLDMPTRVTQSAPFNYERRLDWGCNNNLRQVDIDDVVPNDVNENGIQDGVGEQSLVGVITHTYEYNSANRLLRSNVDASSAGGPETLSTTYSYDSKQLLVATRQPEGNVHTQSYDERDLVFQSVTGASDPATATTTRFDYDGRGRLKQVFDDDGPNSATPAITYDYDTFDRVIRTTDEIGNTSEVAYDLANNPIRTIRRDAGATILSVAHVVYDEAGRPFQATRELFGTEHPLASLGLGASLVGPGTITPVVPTAELVDGVVVYDVEGKPTAACDENLHSATTTYDLANRVVSTTDEEGSTTTLVYDRASNVIRTVTQEVVAGSGLPAVSAGTYFSETFHDQLNRPIATVSHQMNATRLLFDSRGNVRQVSDAMGARGPAAVTLDDFPFAQEHKDASPGGDFPQRAHLSPATDFLGGVTLRGNTTRMVYDNANRPLERVQDLRSGGVGTNASGQSTTITGQIRVASTYDRNSRLVSQVDPNNNATSYVYDDQNRTIATLFADGTSTRLGYNRIGTLATKVDPRGVVETYTYDAKERLTGCSVTNLPTGQGQRNFCEYAYDGLSRRVLAGDDDSETLTAFDSFSRPVRSTQRVGTGAPRAAGQPLTGFVEGVLTRGYDGVGNLIRQVYPSGRQLDRRYDGNDRLALVSDLSASQQVATFTHAGHGGRRLERRQPVPDVTTTYTYDPSRRVVGLTSQQVARSELLVGYAYAYTPVGNRWYEQKLHESNQADFYTYDSAYRLEQVDKDVVAAGVPVGLNNQAVASTVPPAIPSQQKTFTLDAAGNRQQETGGGGPIDYFMQIGLPTTDSVMNQYTQIGAQIRSHDEAGNVTSENDTQRFFDADNRMVQWKTASKDVRYRYDADGRRILKEDRGSGPGAFAPILYFYDGWQCVEETDAAGTLSKGYVYGRGIDEVVQGTVPDVEDLDGDSDTSELIDLFYCHNSLGSVTAVTDSAGVVVERYAYEAYGKTTILDAARQPKASQVPIQPYGFTGRRMDYEEGSGLYFYRLRYYDPEAGRFISRDPLGMWGDEAQRGNAQNYCGNNPVNHVDPLGDAVALPMLLGPIAPVLAATAVIVGGGYVLYKVAQWLGPQLKKGAKNLGILLGEAWAVAWGAYVAFAESTYGQGLSVHGTPRGHVSCLAPGSTAIPLPGAWPPPSPGIDLSGAKDGIKEVADFFSQSLPTTRVDSTANSQSQTRTAPPDDPPPVNLALGLAGPYDSVEVIPLLEFGRRHNALPFLYWPDDLLGEFLAGWVTPGVFKAGFPIVVSRAIQQGSHVYFNLAGITAKSKLTFYEVQQYAAHPEWWDHTTFYLNDRQLSREEASAEIARILGL